MVDDIPTFRVVGCNLEDHDQRQIQNLLSTFPNLQYFMNPRFTVSFHLLRLD